MRKLAAILLFLPAIAHGSGIYNPGSTGANTGTLNPGTTGQVGIYTVTGSTVGGTSAIQVRGSTNVFINDGTEFKIGTGTSNPQTVDILANEAPNPYLAYTIPDVRTADYKGWSDYNTIKAPSGSSYYSVNCRPATSGSHDYSELAGLTSTVGHYSIGTLGSMFGVQISGIVSGGIVNNYYGVRCDDTQTLAGGTITNQYGIFVQAQTKGATNYAIWTDGTTKSRFGGQANLDGAIGNPIHGTNTNDNAATGYVGQYLTSAIQGQNVGAAGTYNDITSLFLTAGDWDVSGIVGVSRNSATFTSAIIFGGISTTPGNDGTGLVTGDTLVYVDFNSASLTFSGVSGSIPAVRESLTAGTTVYLKGYTDGYTAGTPLHYARISARRVR